MTTNRPPNALESTGRIPAQLLMERETRLGWAQVPHELYGEALPENSWLMHEDQFLLRGSGDHYFYYRKGEGVTVERGAGADVSEESLWLNGSVYAAVASINGLLPIHASAVAADGEVYAFTAPAGGGKSTLVAALGTCGMPMFCDDTLVLDLTDPDRIICLPGHKRLKLTRDAIDLTGARQEEKVSATVEKFYAAPPAGQLTTPLPLAELIFLEEGEQASITPISGAERFIRVQDDHYTANLFAWARRFDRPAQFAHLSRLARQIRMARFVRPRDPSAFSDAVAMAASYVSTHAIRAARMRPE